MRAGVEPMSWQNVEVRVRVKPGESCLSIEPKAVTVAGKRFEVDEVYGPSTTQDEVYARAVDPLVAGVRDGYNASVLAYGQTGSGKTFTMEGVIPRALARLTCRVQYVEIYHEEIRDLLGSAKRLERSADATSVEIASEDDVRRVLEVGAGNRATFGTEKNERSSRSHAILIAEGERAKLFCVDLAGSERPPSGPRFKEGISINSGLLALSKVISALCDANDKLQRGLKKHVHVPYRDSKLTRLLQDALGGRSRTVMLACVSCEACDTAETAATLHYASRARQVRNAVVRNAAKVPVLTFRDDENKRLEALVLDAQDKIQRALACSDMTAVCDVLKEPLDAKNTPARVQLQRALHEAAANAESLASRLDEQKRHEASLQTKLATLKCLQDDVDAKELSLKHLLVSQLDAKRALDEYHVAVERGDVATQHDDLRRVHDLRSESEDQAKRIEDDLARLRAQRDALFDDDDHHHHPEDEAKLEKRAFRWLKRRLDEPSPYEALLKLQTDLDGLAPRRQRAVLLEACRQLIANKLAREEDANALALAHKTNSQLRAERKDLRAKLDDVG